MGIAKVSEEGMEGYIKSMQKNFVQFYIEIKRSSHTMFVGGRPVMTLKRAKKTKDNISKYIGSFCKKLFLEVDNYIIRNKNNVAFVERRWNAVFTNKDIWETMVLGSVFYEVDISHAYWRIAFLQGYISEKLYNDPIGGIDKEDVKAIRNKALACLVAGKQRKYYIPFKGILHLEEDRSLHDRIYTNIRHISWNMMGDLKELLHPDCLQYRIDGIKVLRLDDAKGAMDFLESYNLDCTIKKCKKLDDKHFLILDTQKIKRF